MIWPENGREMTHSTTKMTVTTFTQNQKASRTRPNLPAP